MAFAVAAIVMWVVKSPSRRGAENIEVKTGELMSATSPGSIKWFVGTTGNRLEKVIKELRGMGHPETPVACWRLSVDSDSL